MKMLLKLRKNITRFFSMIMIAVVLVVTTPFNFETGTVYAVAGVDDALIALMVYLASLAGGSLTVAGASNSISKSDISIDDITDSFCQTRADEMKKNAITVADAFFQYQTLHNTEVAVDMAHQVSDWGQKVIFDNTTKTAMEGLTISSDVIKCQYYMRATGKNPYELYKDGVINSKTANLLMNYVVTPAVVAKDALGYLMEKAWDNTINFWLGGEALAIPGASAESDFGYTGKIEKEEHGYYKYNLNYAYKNARGNDCRYVTTLVSSVKLAFYIYNYNAYFYYAGDYNVYPSIDGVSLSHYSFYRDGVLVNSSYGPLNVTKHPYFGDSFCDIYSFSSSIPIFSNSDQANAYVVNDSLTGCTNIDKQINGLDDNIGKWVIDNVADGINIAQHVIDNFGANSAAQAKRISGGIFDSVSTGVPISAAVNIDELIDTQLRAILEKIGALALAKPDALALEDTAYAEAIARAIEGIKEEIDALSLSKVATLEQIEALRKALTEVYEKAKSEATTDTPSDPSEPTEPDTPEEGFDFNGLPSLFNILYLLIMIIIALLLLFIACLAFIINIFKIPASSSFLPPEMVLAFEHLKSIQIPKMGITVYDFCMDLIYLMILFSIIALLRKNIDKLHIPRRNL